MKAAIAASVAALLLTGTTAAQASPARPATFHCNPNFDVCEQTDPSLIPIELKPPYLPILRMSMHVKTNYMPESFFQAYQLFRLITFDPRDRGWHLWDHHNFTKADLPQPGDSLTWHWDSECTAPAYWYTKWTAHVVTDQGVPFFVEFYWPFLNWNAKNKKLHKPNNRKPPTVAQAIHYKTC